MRGKLRIICLVLILVVLVGCQKNNKNYGKEGNTSMNNKQHEEIPQEDIDTKNKVNSKILASKPLRNNNSQIKIKSRINGNNILQVKIKNLSKQEISFGKNWKLYWQNKHLWESVERVSDIGIKDIQYILETDEVFSDKIDLRKMFGALDKGKYKIENEIMLLDSRVIVSSEFQIE